MSKTLITSDKGKKKDKLWIFDFDGTLSQIVPDRNAAEMDTACRELIMELIGSATQQVAILSSRTLDDLIPRIRISNGLCIGGSNGLEWIYPDSHKRFYYGALFEEDILSMRKMLIPKLTPLKKIAGVDIEDKQWSLIIHVRGASVSGRKVVENTIKKWIAPSKVELLKAPEEYEVHFSPYTTKTLGVLILCQHPRLRPETQIIYTGDDEDDREAMKCIIRMGGSVISVGLTPLLPDSLHVRNPGELTMLCRKLAGFVD